MRCITLHTMDTFYTYISRKLWLVGLVSTLFIIYPNLACVPWDVQYIEPHLLLPFFAFFFFRLCFFWGAVCLLIRYNLRKLPEALFTRRLIRNLLFSAVAFLIYSVIAYVVNAYGHGVRTDFLRSIVIFQFFIMCLICTFIGYIGMLYTRQREKEQEIERLKIENLQSRCDALTNQINPHFFFNSLNGLTALIRKGNDANTLTYVNKLSDVFRYILQSDKKGLVTLGEELEFVHAFRYMMEVRFANKLEFRVDVAPEALALKLPVLSLLPLIDNVVVHNRIDSEHRMQVDIRMSTGGELLITNPLYPKLSAPDTNGTGLLNLMNRFMLLTNKQIRVEECACAFTVYLPLI